MSFRYLIPVGIKLALATLALAAVFRLAFGLNEDALRLKSFDDRKAELDSLVIGNSHGRAFHFASLGANGFYMNKPSFDIEEAIRSASVAVDQSPGLKRVYMALFPLSFHVSLRHVYDNYEERRMYVRNATPWKLSPSGYSLLEYVRSALRRVLPIEHIQKSAYALVGYEVFDKSIRAKTRFDHCFEHPNEQLMMALQQQVDVEGFTDIYKMSGVKHDCLDDIAALQADIRAENIEATLAANPNIANLNMDRLLRFADKLHGRGIELIIVRPPLTQNYFELEQFQHLPAEYEAVMQAVATHPTVTVLDYTRFFRDPPADTGQLMFFDDTHLSIHGAIQFSQHLKETLDSMEGN